MALDVAEADVWDDFKHAQKTIALSISQNPGLHFLSNYEWDFFFPIFYLRSYTLEQDP